MDFLRIAHTILVDRRRVKWRDVFVANPGEWNKTKMLRPLAKCTGLGSVASGSVAKKVNLTVVARAREWFAFSET
jgi:hypothetical protein